MVLGATYSIARPCFFLRLVHGNWFPAGSSYPLPTATTTTPLPLPTHHARACYFYYPLRCTTRRCPLPRPHPRPPVASTQLSHVARLTPHPSARLAAACFQCGTRTGGSSQRPPRRCTHYRLLPPTPTSLPIRRQTLSHTSQQPHKQPCPQPAEAEPCTSPSRPCPPRRRRPPSRRAQPRCSRRAARALLADPPNART